MVKRYDQLFLADTVIISGQLSDADFEGAQFQNARFESTFFSGSSFIDANLSGATLLDCSAHEASFLGCNLKGATLHGVYLENALMNGSPWDGTNVHHEGMRKTNWWAANFFQSISDIDSHDDRGWLSGRTARKRLRFSRWLMDRNEEQCAQSREVHSQALDHIFAPFRSFLKHVEDIRSQYVNRMRSAHDQPEKPSKRSDSTERDATHRVGDGNAVINFEFQQAVGRARDLCPEYLILLVNGGLWPYEAHASVERYVAPLRERLERATARLESCGIVQDLNRTSMTVL